MVAEYERQVQISEKQIISGAISDIANTQLDFNFDTPKQISDTFDANMKGLLPKTTYNRFQFDVGACKKDRGESILSDLNRTEAKYRMLVAFKAHSEMYNESFNPRRKRWHQDSLLYIQGRAQAVTPQRPY